jgi:ubiquinone biosynthesis protein UbiJ
LKGIARTFALGAIAATAVAACGSSNSSPAASSSSASKSAPSNATAPVALSTAMRTLWMQHMEWTYETVDDFFHDQAALTPTLNRLLQNQRDIGAAIVPYYGQAAGTQLTNLLLTHIQQAVPVLTAAKDGDKAKLAAAESDWYANAKQIADFLSTANPNNWPTSVTEPMMKTHIDQTTTYSVDLLKGDYAQAITDYGTAEQHMIEMADALSKGIIAQFPQKVSLPQGDNSSSTSGPVALSTAMQTLWMQHMEWTYATVDAFFHNQAALTPTLNRLLQDQRDIGAAIVPYYGQAAGTQLTNLLLTHIQEAVPVLTAAKAGDKAKLDAAESAWYANAKQIADFLSQANPNNWPTSATEPLLKMHIDQTTTYSVDLLKGDFAQAIADYDKAEQHMISLADTLSKGIIAQFPNKVSS